ncbi:MAG TPA: ATP-binding protein [Acidimicrobiales bacterium]|nr:ATP-binding protein [Acidimicrobiales bacterium]
MARRLLATYLTITAFALAVVVIPLGLTFASRERDRLVFDIERDAQAVASLVEDALEAGVAPTVDDVLRDYAGTGGRIVVVGTDGISVADSDPGAAVPRDFSTRPEIAAALDGRRTSGSRSSETLGTNLMYVTVPVASAGIVHGAVRVTYPTSTLDARVRSTWLRLGALSVLVLVLVAAVGMVLARSVSRPVRHLRDAAARMAAGDLSARADVREGAPELRALADTLNRTAERLGVLVDAQHRFVADASHQLRTPLTALRLRLEMLETSVPPAAHADLAAALAEATRLGQLVQSLLVLARTDAATPECGTVDLAAVVAGRADAWRPVAGDHGIDLGVDVPGPVPVRAAAGALEQILDNLVSNAIEAAPAGSPVTVAVSTSDRWVELHVVDRGPGLPPEARAHAFERFWRPAGAPGPGFGLGLAIVRQLARACGGDAVLAPGPDGCGLDATVRLARPGVVSQDLNPALTSA